MISVTDKGELWKFNGITTHGFYSWRLFFFKWSLLSKPGAYSELGWRGEGGGGSNPTWVNLDNRSHFCKFLLLFSNFLLIFFQHSWREGGNSPYIYCMFKMSWPSLVITKKIYFLETSWTHGMSSNRTVFFSMN